MSSRPRRFLADLGTAVTVPLAVASALGAAWFTVWFQLMGATADRDDFLDAAATERGGAVVVVALSVLVVAWTPRRWWLLIEAVAGAAVLFWAAEHHLDRAALAEPGAGIHRSYVQGAATAVAPPTAWPLLVLGTVALGMVVGRVWTSVAGGRERVGP